MSVYCYNAPKAKREYREARAATKQPKTEPFTAGDEEK
jgi:hypothetical protein